MRSIALSVAFAGSAAAQLVSPSPYGGGCYPYPFGNLQQAIYQQIHGDLRGRPLLVGKLSFDSYQNTEDGDARAVAVEIKMGHGIEATASSTFAANFTSPPTTVFLAKTVQLPSQRQALPKFSISFALDQSFAFSGNEDLVWQATVFSNSFPWSYYLLKGSGSSDSISGQHTSTGHGCMTTGAQSSFVLLYPRLVSSWLKQAVWFTAVSDHGPLNAPHLLMLGARNPSLSVPGLCATLLVDPLLTVAATTGGIDLCSFPPQVVPYTPALQGAIIYAQVAALDAGQPGLPITLTDGAKMVVVAPPVPLPFTSVSTKTTTATSGFLWHDMIVAIELR